jgi:SAM-dependent methyltransferase
LNVNDNFLRRYLEIAPTALALERSYECELLARRVWQGPILDIGCGDGIFAKMLFHDELDTGIDPDLVEVERARQLGAYRELIVCSGDAVPKPDGSYATIFSNSVLEHVPNLSPVLEEIHRLLAPDGRFYATLPSDRVERAAFPARLLFGLGLRNAGERYGAFYNRFWRHYNVHPEAGWRAVFDRAGFEVVDERPYVPPNVSTFYDLLTPLGLPAAITRRLLKRWMLFPRLRRYTAGAIHWFVTAVVGRLQRQPGGCLIFYELKKKPAAA